MKVKCTTCSQIFEKKPSLCSRSKSHYCSSICRNSGAMIKCAICDTIFYRLPSRTTKFCSKACYSASVRETRVCVGCGDFFEVRKVLKDKYCSLSCYREVEERPQQRVVARKKVKCSWCGFKFIAMGGRLTKHHIFCSTACHNDYQGRNKTTHNCKICGTEFRWSASKTKSGHNPSYCSIACRNKCPEWKENAVIAGNLKLQNSKQPTKLELAGNAILDSLGLVYETQVLIERKFCVDVRLILHCRYNVKGIIIQWDGDYWHGYKYLKGEYPDDLRCKRRMQYDESQDAYMHVCGYKVLRFWEHEVHNNPEKVSATIKRAIKFAQ